MRKALLVITIILLVISVGFCQESKQPLILTIKSDKQLYKAGEEIKLDFQVTNNSEKPIVIGHNHPEQLEDKQDVLIVATTLNGKLGAMCILDPAWKRDTNEKYHKVIVNAYKTINFRGVPINPGGKCYIQ